MGTLGHNELIDKLVAKKKLNVSLLKERWESYLVEIVHNPFPGVNKALIVVGSDRRGTAYGLLSISELIGVSPWYWWADAPVAKYNELNIKVDKFVSKNFLNGKEGRVGFRKKDIRKGTWKYRS